MNKDAIDALIRISEPITHSLNLRTNWKFVPGWSRYRNLCFGCSLVSLIGSSDRQGLDVRVLLAGDDPVKEHASDPHVDEQVREAADEQHDREALDGARAIVEQHPASCSGAQLAVEDRGKHPREAGVDRTAHGLTLVELVAYAFV